MDENRALELVTQAVAELEVGLRQAFLLREVDQLSYCQIAEVLAIPESSVAVRIEEARTELLQKLKSLGWEN